MTTMTAPSVIDTMTRDEARILAHFAAGESLDTIAAETRQPRGDVALTIDGYAKNDRSRAQQLALAWQRANPAARHTPQPAPATPAGPDHIADLLTAAADSGVPRLVRAADRIQDLVDQLGEQLAEHERGQALRSEADRLEKRLAEIRRELGPKRQPALIAHGEQAAELVDRKAIRAWAAASGIACPDRGRVPSHVIAAYKEAHQ